MYNKKTITKFIFSLLVYIIAVIIIHSYNNQIIWGLSIIVYFINLINIKFSIDLKHTSLIYLSLLNFIISQSLALYNSYLFNKTDNTGILPTNGEIRIEEIGISVIIYICIFVLYMNINKRKFNKLK
jgi:vacuolar-type H+-ATPase subunit I/STV1